MKIAAVLSLLLLVAPQAQARRGTRSDDSSKASKASDASKTRGLGKSCHKSSDCRSKAQRCLKESDANGKPLDAGFCALPCLSFEAGTTKVVPGVKVAPSTKDEKRKKPIPRCPAHYQCRGADAGSPIDMCVKE